MSVYRSTLSFAQLYTYLPNSAGFHQFLQTSHLGWEGFECHLLSDTHHCTHQVITDVDGTIPQRRRFTYIVADRNQDAHRIGQYWSIYSRQCAYPSVFMSFRMISSWETSLYTVYTSNVSTTTHLIGYTCAIAESHQKADKAKQRRYSRAVPWGVLCSCCMYNY